MADNAHYANLIAGFGSLALSIGLGLCITAIARNMPARIWTVFAACAGVFGEWVFAHMFPVSMAMTQHANPAALRLSSVTGFWGVTFIIWGVSASLAVLLTHRIGGAKRALVIPATVVVLAVGALLGQYRISGSTVRVAVVQAPDTYTLREETAKLQGRASIVVWPENGMLPGDSDVIRAAKENGMHIAANFLEPQSSGKPLNTSYYISPEGTVLGKFRKQHLFGSEIFHYGKAEVRPPAVSDEFGLKIGVPTCYDTMFTDVVRNYVRDGARLILVPNCDPDAPNHLFARMHAAMTAFRAAENGVPIALADSLAISTIFDSSGRVVAQTKPGAEAVSASVVPRSGRTVYNRIGDSLAYLCMAFLIFVLVSIVRERGVTSSELRVRSREGRGWRVTMTSRE